MDNSLKGLILAAGVIITCIVVGLGFFISREAKNASDSGTNQLSAMSSEYDNVEFMMYDGLKVTGREVENVKQRNNNSSNSEISITVNTKDGLESQINPSGLFMGKLVRNTNDVITELVFTQQ